jgi:tetratricopeptide (TPR) repeat protein
LNKESVLIAVVALFVGFLGGYLIGAMSSVGKPQAAITGMNQGAASSTDYAQRITEAEKIVVQDPKNLNAWLSLGNDYFDTEQPQKSINAYAKVLELQPNNTSVLTDQGVMYRKMGWYDKAMANFEKAQKIDPNHLQSLFNMGIVYDADLKQPDKAAEIWSRYLKLDPTSPTAIQIKQILQKSGSGAKPDKK